MSETGRQLRPLENQLPPGCGYSLEAIIALQKALEHGIASAVEERSVSSSTHKSGLANPRTARPEADGERKYSRHLLRGPRALVAWLMAKFARRGRSAQWGA